MQILTYFVLFYIIIVEVGTLLMRVLIFSGGNIDTVALTYIKDDDYIIGVDRGAYFLYSHKAKMNLAIGDFDSVTYEQANEIRSYANETIACDPINKDESDTEMAFNYAIKLNPTEILLFGVLGSRFDHSIANIHLLYKGLQAGICCTIIGKMNKIQLTANTITITKDDFQYVSLLPLFSEVHGITLNGFQYPLHNASLKIGDSLGISNVLTDSNGRISISSGVLVVIQSKDC